MDLPEQVLSWKQNIASWIFWGKDQVKLNFLGRHQGQEKVVSAATQSNHFAPEVAQAWKTNFWDLLYSTRARKQAMVLPPGFATHKENHV